MSNNWGSKFMLGAANGINELFAKFWTIFILFIVYALFCVMLSSITGLDPIIFFWGIPVFFFAVIFFVVIGSLGSGDSATKKATKTGTKTISATTKPDIWQHGKDSLTSLSTIQASSVDAETLVVSIADFVCQEPPAFQSIDELKNLEGLYLSIMLRAKSASIAKQFLSNAIFTQMTYEEHDKCVEIAAQIFDEKIAMLTESDADNALETLHSAYFTPRLKGKAKRFPTGMSLLNIQAVPEGSFLEAEATQDSNNWMSERVITDAISTLELRRLAEIFNKGCGEKIVDSYLKRSLAMGQKHSRKKIEKELAKNKLTATNIKTIRQQCAQLCYTSNFSEIEAAIEFANKARERVESNAKTKAMKEAVASLEAFPRLEMGVADERAEEDIKRIKQTISNLAMKLEAGPDSISPNFVDECIGCSATMLSMRADQLETQHYLKLKQLLVSVRLDIYDFVDEGVALELSGKLTEAIKNISARCK